MTLPNPSNRLYTLDVLRGLAALCVVFWHWQHFFYVGSAAQDFDPAQQPFFSTFELLYRHGNLAVQLFFTLSGFVFYWLFANGISRRALTVSRFAQDRFSRLYPLHIVTFMAVLALQWAYLSSHGTYFIYPFNDVYHAVLNVLMMPAWGLEKGWSFNAPVWSVSVEVLLYAIFFIICLTERWKWPLTLAAIAIGSFLYPDTYKLGSGLVCFFVGGMTYGVLTWMRRYLGDGGALLITGPFCLVAWIWLLQTPAGLSNPSLLYVCYLLLIAALAAAGSRWPDLARRWAWLGDISYSSYLTHFPLQIIFAMAFEALALSRTVFYEGWVMVLFFAVLIPLSLATHRYLERPAQRWLRQRGRQVSALTPN